MFSLPPRGEGKGGIPSSVHVPYANDGSLLSLHFYAAELCNFILPNTNTCPDCRKPLKTYDESIFQKKWYGYLNNDERMIDHLVLVEFNYYDDDSFEVKVPLLNLEFKTKDFSEAINIPDEKILSYLKDKYKKHMIVSINF